MLRNLTTGAALPNASSAIVCKACPQAKVDDGLADFRSKTAIAARRARERFAKKYYHEKQFLFLFLWNPSLRISIYPAGGALIVSQKGASTAEMAEKKRLTKNPPSRTQALTTTFGLEVWIKRADTLSCLSYFFIYHIKISKNSQRSLCETQHENRKGSKKTKIQTTDSNILT